jgi:hypothetical protein
MVSAGERACRRIEVQRAVACGAGQDVGKIGIRAGNQSKGFSRRIAGVARGARPGWRLR